MDTDLAWVAWPSMDSTVFDNKRVLTSYINSEFQEILSRKMRQNYKRKSSERE